MFLARVSIFIVLIKHRKQIRLDRSSTLQRCTRGPSYMVDQVPIVRSRISYRRFHTIIRRPSTL
ncbi:hypothetical protein HanPSC8_Chr01g0042291 [Helianthus annuus]|nr:hypothetical protein HanPSC8_Chr01g0042291 [Helianthus annuus]